MPSIPIDTLLPESQGMKSANVTCRGRGGYMKRSPEVEQLAIAWLADMKGGDAVGSTPKGRM